MAGLSIRRVGSDSPGFWYDYPGGTPKAKFIRDTLLSHVANCGREGVRVDGEDVTREIPPGEWLVAFGTVLMRDKDGNVYVENPEPVDAEKILKG